jgi:hypothetical protein
MCASKSDSCSAGLGDRSCAGWQCALEHEGWSYLQWAADEQNAAARALYEPFAHDMQKSVRFGIWGRAVA